MSYNRAFWADDEEDDPYAIPSQELGAVPEEDIPDAPGMSVPEMYGRPGELPDISAGEDQSLNNFIHSTGGSAIEQDGPLAETRLAPEDRARADELHQDFAHRNGGDFEQEAYADMRHDILNRGSGLRAEDAIFPAIASFLDLGMNKGRGLGQIAMGTYAGMNAREQADSDAVKDLGNLSIRAAQDQRHADEDEWQRGYRDRMLGVSEGNVGLRGEELQLQRERERRLGMPHAMDPTEAAYKQALTKKTLADIDKTPGALTEDQKIDNARADRTEKRTLEKDDAAATLAADKTKRAHERIPGSVIRDQAAWEAASGDPVLKRKIIAAVQGAGRSMGALNEMRDLRQQGPMLPLVDAERQGKYDMARRSALGGFSPMFELGTLQKHDIDLIEPTIPGAINIKDAATLVGEDPNSDALSGARQEFGKLIASQLRPYGIDLDPEEAIKLAQAADAVGGGGGGAQGPNAVPGPTSGNAPRPETPAANPLGFDPKATPGVLPVTRGPTGKLPSVQDFLQSQQLSAAEPGSVNEIDPGFIGQQPAPGPAPIRLGGQPLGAAGGGSANMDGKTVRTIMTPSGLETLPLSDEELSYLISKGAKVQQ